MSDHTGATLAMRRPLMASKDLGKYLKPAVFALALVPFVLLVVRAFSDDLGANPVEKIEHVTGLWALRFLLITLSITPLRRLTHWNTPARLRRMLGLFVFFYVCLHFSTWLVFDHSLNLAEMLKDIRKRPYITVGFSAFLLLIPLAVTSTNAMVKRLGGLRWRRLHSMVYVIGTLAILHFLWLVKADKREPIFYGVILITLLVLRLPAMLKRPPTATRVASQSG